MTVQRAIAMAGVVWFAVACARAGIEPTAASVRPADTSGDATEASDLAWLAPAPDGSLALAKTAHQEIPGLHDSTPYPWDVREKQQAAYLARYPRARATVASAAAWMPTASALATVRLDSRGVEVALYHHDEQTPYVTRRLARDLPEWMADEQPDVSLEGPPSGGWFAIRVRDVYLEIVSGRDLASLAHAPDADAIVELVSDERVIWMISGCVCEGTSSRRHQVLLLQEGGARTVLELKEQDSGYHWGGAEYALGWSAAGVFWAYSSEAVTTWDLTGKQNRVPLRGLVDSSESALSGEYYSDDAFTMWPTILRVAGSDRVEILTFRGTTLHFVALSAASAVERGRIQVPDVQQLAWAEDGDEWAQTRAGVFRVALPR